MAGRVNETAANELVRENFGLTADDLGMNPGEDSFLSDTDDIGEGDIGGDGDQNLDNNIDDLGGGDDVDPLFSPAPKQPQQPQPQKQQQQPPAATRIPPTAEVRVDSKGNLIDKKTGQIVAKAGSESRMYQKLHATTAAYGRLEAQHNDVQGRLNKAVEIGNQLYERLQSVMSNQTATSPAKYGLNDMEAIQALTFAKEAKADPVGTIKKLLTKAAADGIDLTQIGLAGGNFDPKAFMDLIRGEIGTAMNPLKERSQRETEQERTAREAQERQDQAAADLNSFLASNPDAKPFLPVFHQVYSQPQFQHMPLSEVWARIQLNLLRRQQSQPSRQQRPANQQQRRPGVPSGQRNAPQGGGRQKTDLAPVSDSYEDIVRDVLKTSTV